jgi:xylulokinase
MSYLVGINIGTTGTTTAIFDEYGNTISKGYTEYNLIMPRKNWVEQNPETWWKAVCHTAKSALKVGKINPKDIAGIGVVGQTNGVVMLDSKGNILDNALLWLDARATEEAREVKKKYGGKEIYHTLGIRIDPFHMYIKLLWVKKHIINFNKCYRILSSNSFISFRLTGNYYLDITQASCGGLLDIKKKDYAYSLMDELGVPSEKLPDLVNPSEVIGEINEKSARELGLPKNIPVVAGCGDVMSNAVGAGLITPRKAYHKIGTASDIVACIEKPAFDSQIRVVCYSHAIPDKWLIIGGTNGGGIIYRWMRDRFMKGKNYEKMNNLAERVPAGCEGLIFLPYLFGVRSPHWDRTAKGVFFGITNKHYKRHFIRAIMEGISFSMKERLDIIEELGVNIEEIIAVGGGSQSSLWRQIMADISYKPIIRLVNPEQETLGAIILAGVGAKIFPSIEYGCKRTVHIREKIKPNYENKPIIEKTFKIYKSLYFNLKECFKALEADKNE